MKAVILAGGLGTRLGEETHLRPKPMLEVGGQPILWHIMKIYSQHGINDFVILLGYKGWMIKDYFLNYLNHRSDITIDVAKNSVDIHRSNDCEPWKVTLLETGADTLTGGRLLRARHHLEGEPFMLTYGDGVADIDISALLKFHQGHGKTATLSAVCPEARFGAIGMESNGRINSFQEKPVGEGGLINGGFMVFQPNIFDYLKDGDATILERSPLEQLSKTGELFAYHHPGFWHCMDTKRDMDNLNKLWHDGRAPWKTWNDGTRQKPLTDRAA